MDSLCNLLENENISVAGVNLRESRVCVLGAVMLSSGSEPSA